MSFLTAGLLACAILSRLEGETKLPIHSLRCMPSLALDERIYRDLRIGATDGTFNLFDLVNQPVLIDQPLAPNFLSDRRGRWQSFNYHPRIVSSSDSSLFVLEPRFTYRIDVGKDKSITRRASGIQFYGVFRNWFGYRFRFADNTESGNGPYVSRSQLMLDRAGYVGPLMGGKSTYYDETDATLNWGNRHLNVTYGREKISWGPGQRTNLLISDNAPSFDQLRARLRISDQAQFTYLLGKLHPTAGLVSDTMLYETSQGWQRITLDPKWIVAHRLEYTPRDWLMFSVSEALVWGERGLDMAFLNPLYFLYSAQHDGGDRDNVLLSGDFVARFDDVGYIYGALLIDDLKISSIGEGNPGNKLAVLAGANSTSMTDLSMSFNIEYVRLEPFVYSHFFPINRFSNWNSSLGADLPPNSDRFELTLECRPTFDLTFTLSSSMNRHGTIGGTIEESIPRSPIGKVYFLDGVRQDWISWRSSVEWEVITGGVLEAGVVNNDKYSLIPSRYYLSAGYRI